jgi:uncharacterized protein YndB with AHSA1/START domain
MNTDRIQKSILLHATLARVWRAISDSAEFGSWFGMRLDGPFVPGKMLRAAIAATTVDDEVAKLQKPHEGMTFEIRVETVEPERLLSFRWHPFATDRSRDYTTEPTTLVSFELKEEPGGVLVTITESGFDRLSPERRASAFAANDGGWSMQTQLLQKYVARAA